MKNYFLLFFSVSVFSLCGMQKAPANSSELFAALAFNDIETTKQLLLDGADPNETNEQGQTPMHIACLQKKDTAFIELYIQHGADLTIATKKHRFTPLHYAASQHDSITIKTVIDAFLLQMNKQKEQCNKKKRLKSCSLIPNYVRERIIQVCSYCYANKRHKEKQTSKSFLEKRALCSLLSFMDDEGKTPHHWFEQEEILNPESYLPDWYDATVNHKYIN